MSRKNVLVIGAGIVGASIALHCIRLGCRVTIVDAAPAPGGVATANSFAWINASWGNPESYFHFRRRSMDGWKRLSASVPGLHVDWCGGLLWDLPDDRLEDYARQHSAWGYGIRRVDRAGALAIEPGLLTPPARALHIAEEGMVEPAEAARALGQAAIHAGALFRPDTKVSALRLAGDRITGAELQDGDAIDADETVLAAGADCARLVGTAGRTLRMSTPAGLIAHSTIASRRLLNGMVMAPEFHVRQSREGRLVVGADFAGGDPEGRPDGAGKELIERVRQAIDGASDLRLAFTTIGHRPTPADGFPAIGRLPGSMGLYVAVLHSGITLAPLVGELAAGEISGGNPDPDLAPYDPGRLELA